VNAILIHSSTNQTYYVDATDALPEGRTISSATVTPLNSGITAGAATVFSGVTEVGGREVAIGKGFYFRLSGATKGKRDLGIVMTLDNGDTLGETLPLTCYA
jgi:hypothetical protein